jgi:hypothetical protein
MTDDDKCGAVDEMRIGRGNWSTQRKLAILFTTNPHDLTWDWTQATAVGSQRLMAWAMAQPYLGIKWKWVVSFMPSRFTLRERDPHYPLDRRLDELQGQPGRCRGEKNLLPCRELNPSHPACSPLLYRLNYPSSMYYTLMFQNFQCPGFIITSKVIWND